MPDAVPATSTRRYQRGSSARQVLAGHPPTSTDFVTSAESCAALAARVVLSEATVGAGSPLSSLDPSTVHPCYGPPGCATSRNAWAAHPAIYAGSRVRHALRPALRRLHQPARQGTAVRRGHRRDRARDPHRPARGRRRAARRPRVHRADQGAGAQRGGLEGAQPGPAGHQDRQRRAGRDPGRRDPAAPVRQAAPDRDHARRPAGRRQDDARRQARALAARAGPRAAARRLRPAASERREPVAGRRRAGRRPDVRARARQRRRRPGAGRARLDRVRPPRAARHGRRRHRRPPRHRRRHDAAGDRHPRRSRPAGGPVRRRRDGRPGRREHRPGLPGRRRLHRRRPHQARRRRTRRCGAVGARGDRSADHVRVQRREARGLRRLPPRPDGLAHPRHGRHAHADRDGAAALRRGRGREDGREARGRQPVHARGLPRPAAWRSARWVRSATCSG